MSRREARDAAERAAREEQEAQPPVEPETFTSIIAGPDAARLSDAPAEPAAPAESAAPAEPAPTQAFAAPAEPAASDAPTTAFPEGPADATEVFARRPEPVESPFPTAFLEPAAMAPAPAPPEIDVPGPPRGGGDGPVAGIAAMVRRNPRAWLAGALGLAFLLLATGSFALGSAIGAATAAPGAPTVGEEPVAERRAPDGAPGAVPISTCSIAAQRGADALKTLSGVVLDADGDPLLSIDGEEPVNSPAAVKLVTASTALAVMGPTFQISTRVTDGVEEGEIVLVGRGDATLSRLPGSQEGVYQGAPKLSDLAEQAVSAFAQRHPEQQIERVSLDTSYWSEATAPGGWPSDATAQGRVSLPSPLQVDGDREDPAKASSPRSDDPAARAGQAFLDALRAADGAGVLADDVEVAGGEAADGATLLGEVSSQPLNRLVTQMLQSGDETLAEMLARIASVESGGDGASGSLAASASSALATYGADTEGLSIRDGSGRSGENRVQPTALAELMVDVREGRQQLAVVRDAMSVAGESGLLAQRFGGDAASARGKVTAVSGSNAGATSLTGWIEADDGTQLTFSLTASGEGVNDSTRTALDAVVARVAACGERLARY